LVEVWQLVEFELEDKPQPRCELGEEVFQGEGLVVKGDGSDLCDYVAEVALVELHSLFAHAFDCL
jgi:hypothetical protein